MRLMLAMGLLLVVPGCAEIGYVPPEVPAEIEAVLGDPRFSEVVEITHQGNLDNLDGCWGSFLPEEGKTDAMFYRFSGEEFRMVLYEVWHTYFGDFEIVGVEVGTFTVTGDNTIAVTFTESWTQVPGTGELELMPRPEGEPSETPDATYEVTLDGDRMEMLATGIDPEVQYPGTFWRFEECP